MSAKVKNNIHTLNLLSKAPKKLRVAVIENSKSDLVNALCEVIHNVLEGTVKLKPDESRRLKRYHRALLEITNKSLSVDKKKKLIAQRGGFLLTLLPPALALLTTLLSRL